MQLPFIAVASMQLPNMDGHLVQPAVKISGRTPIFCDLQSKYAGGSLFFHSRSCKLVQLPNMVVASGATS
jgi:hypothetical protein